MGNRLRPDGVAPADQTHGCDGQATVSSRLTLRCTWRENTNRRSSIDGRTTCHRGYAVPMCIRERIEDGFVWIKTCDGLAKTRHKGTDRP